VPGSHANLPKILGDHFSLNSNHFINVKPSG
jgi:hypothetical protein